MKKTLAFFLCVLLVVGLAACGGKDEPREAGSAPSPSPAAAPTAPEESPVPDGEEGRFHHVSIDVADYGVIQLELDSAAAPITVENFLKLARSGFYDGLTFHRIMAGFMIQGGDPWGNGYGGSDETIYGEFLLNGWDNPISHTRGVVSMARGQDPDSARSQFFICHADVQDSLDGLYAAFGRVTEGMEVVDAICIDAQPVDGNGTILPEEQPVITAVTVID